MALWAFVSDIHGNRRGLETAETEARAAGVDAFACLGDVIGRGDPAACVAWVRDVAALAIVGNRDLDYLDRVPPDLQDVVRRWPHEAAASDFLASHGDPRCPAWFFGHTHRARIWEIGADGARLVRPEVTIMPGARYVVNVGTAGLPLPGRGGPSFALYDDARGTLRLVPQPSASRRPMAPRG